MHLIGYAGIILGTVLFTYYGLHCFDLLVRRHDQRQWRKELERQKREYGI